MGKNRSSRHVLRLFLAALVLLATASVASTTRAQAPGNMAFTAVQRDGAGDEAGESAERVAAQQVTRVNVYLIALNDNGRSGRRIGCNDSVVPVRVTVNPTQIPLRAAFNQLFAITGSNYAGRYNALYRSTLSAGRLSISGGTARIELFGNIAVGGVCDIPRVVAQIEETARQFPSVRTVTILVNGTPIQDVLSQR